MKKIFIDDLPLRSGHSIRGMGMYTRNLISSVSKQIEKISEFTMSPSISDSDLVHYPYFDLFFNSLHHQGSSKSVVTIPDVIPLLYPDRYPPGIRGNYNLFKQKRALSNIDAVITISETSKKDIVRLLGVPAEKVHVTYLAPSFKFKKSSEKEDSIKLPNKFVLYVGDVNYNKNLLTLVKAVKKLKTNLVIVGKQAVEDNYDKDHIENQELRKLQEKYGDDNSIIRLGFLSNEELNYVWNKASLYCQPSYYEGFGLPVLEAMQAGVPVVASKTQALVEVVHDAAEYFDPNSTSELAKKIDNLLSSPSTRNQLINEGNQRVKEFSWVKTAKETLNVYAKVLS